MCLGESWRVLCDGVAFRNYELVSVLREELADYEHKVFRLL